MAFASGTLSQKRHTALQGISVPLPKAPVRVEALVLAERNIPHCGDDPCQPQGVLGEGLEAIPGDIKAFAGALKTKEMEIKSQPHM